jgi:hypothetical protein
VLDDDGEFKIHPEAIFDREKMKKGNVVMVIGYGSRLVCPRMMPLRNNCKNKRSNFQISTYILGRGMSKGSLIESLVLVL